MDGAPPPSCAPAPRSPANEHCELEEGELVYHLSSRPQTMRMQADRQARLSYHFSCLLHMHSRAGVIMPQTTWGKYWCIDRRGEGSLSLTGRSSNAFFKACAEEYRMPLNYVRNDKPLHILARDIPSYPMVTTFTNSSSDNPELQG